jgi:hypothetical protein
MGIIMAGPISHIICLMAKGYDIEYNLGIDGTKPVPTKAFFSELKKINKKKAASVSQNVQEQLPVIQEQSEGGGFMGMAGASEEMSEEI